MHRVVSNDTTHIKCLLDHHWQPLRNECLYIVIVILARAADDRHQLLDSKPNERGARARRVRENGASLGIIGSASRWQVWVRWLNRRSWRIRQLVVYPVGPFVAVRADADIRLRLLQTASTEKQVIPNLLSINSTMHAMESRNFGF